MFANLQSSLGGSSAAPLPGSSRDRRPKREEPPVEKLDDVDSIISQISDMSIRADRSAQQIKRNIAASSCLSQMSEEEWNKLCDSLLDTGIDENEADFVVGLFATLLEHEEFGNAMIEKLKDICSSFILEGADNDKIPCFLGVILCYNWPRHLSKAIDTVNPILFIAVCVIKGWLQVLETDNNVPESLSDVEDEEEMETETPEVVNRCAMAVSALCDSTQRSLWMKWPELCDEIYAAIKPAITHNNRITGDAKAGLLQTMIALHMWTKSKAVTNRSTFTQTV